MRKGRSIYPLSLARGYTLVELLVGMAILAIVATGMMSGLFVGRHLAESTIYQNTSFTVAQGYIEQIKSIEYVLLRNAQQAYENNKGTVSGWTQLDDDAYQTSALAKSIMLETKSIDASTTGVASTIDVETEAPLYIGTWIERDVLLDIRDPGEESERKLVMPMRFKVEMTDLSESSDKLSALEIVLTYRYEFKNRGQSQWLEGKLRCVKSNAPTF